MKKIFIYLSIVALFSCTNEEVEELYPSEKPGGKLISIEYALNQGTKIYAPDIKNLYDNHLSVMFYEFERGIIDYGGASSTRIHYTPAKEEYVGDIFAFFVQLSNNFGDSWTEFIYPRNIFIVDTIATASSPRTMVWSNGSMLAKMIIGGGGEKSHAFLVTDKPNPAGLQDLTNTNAEKRARILFRSKLFYDTFTKKLEAGDFEIPDSFKENFRNINPTEYNALNSTQRLAYIREQGYLALENSSLTLKKYFEIKTVGSSTYPDLVTGVPLGTKEYNALVQAELKEYVRNLFRVGIEVFMTNKKIPNTTSYYSKFPRIIEIANDLLSKSKDFLDVDLSIMLSEEALWMPSDKL